MTLYHCTWGHNVPSILQNGLIPSHNPNKWHMPQARKRSRGKTFLCTDSRRPYWTMTYEDGWAGYPTDPNTPLVWLAIDTTGLNLTADQSPNEDYDGDFYTTQTIPPDRITLAPELPPPEEID